MDWNTVCHREIPPSDRQLDDYIGSPLWHEFNARIQKAYQIEPSMEYSRCSMQPGWNVKYKKGGKSLCTLYPMSGYFIALVVIGAKEMTEAELMILSCSEYVQGIFRETQAGQGQKWLMLDVKDKCTAEDILDLISLRRKPEQINMA